MIGAQQFGRDDRILNRDDLSAGPQSDCFGQWHQKQPVIREADDFRIDSRAAFGRNHADRTDRKTQAAGLQNQTRHARQASSDCLARAAGGAGAQVVEQLAPVLVGSKPGGGRGRMNHVCTQVSSIPSAAIERCQRVCSVASTLAFEVSIRQPPRATLGSGMS